MMFHCSVFLSEKWVWARRIQLNRCSRRRRNGLQVPPPPCGDSELAKGEERGEPTSRSNMSILGAEVLFSLLLRSFDCDHKINPYLKKTMGLGLNHGYSPALPPLLRIPHCSVTERNVLVKEGWNKGIMSEILKLSDELRYIDTTAYRQRFSRFWMWTNLFEILE